MLGARLSAISRAVAAISTTPVGEVTLTASSGTWTVPIGVTKISVVCIGAGGRGNNQNVGSRAGGGGGGLCYKNNITVTPGQQISYTVSQATAGNTTTFQSMAAYPGQGSSGGDNAGGTAQGGDANFSGGVGRSGSLSVMSGGGAASYTANGIDTQDANGPGGVAKTGKPINAYGLDPSDPSSIYGMGGYSDDSGNRGYGQNGVIRIVWGNNASFPGNALTASNPVGEAVYTVPGSYSFTVPAGVTSVSVVCVGAGGAQYAGNSNNCGGGGGGALAYKNNFAVTPGQNLSVIVGARGVFNNNSINYSPSGGDSSFASAVYGGGGQGAYNPGGQVNPGLGGTVSGTAGPSGGNGSAGNLANSTTFQAGSAGRYTGTPSVGGSQGIDLYGSDLAGPYGRGDNQNVYNTLGSNSTDGAVRIIWGTGRAFPNAAS